jgi:UDP-GlcNAc:undecaprenyl-phosphate GlcNAc-1-phosphate transferase
VCAALVLFHFGFGVPLITNPFGPPIASGHFNLPLTVIWVVVVMNAINLIDGLDGLATGVVFISCCALWWVGHTHGNFYVLFISSTLIGATFGFLRYNFPPARIFMGDAGSLVVGYMLATVSVLTTYYQSGASAPPYALAMPLVVLAVPLYDFVSVVVIRLAEGRNPMRGDQRHFSHRLVERGLSRRMAVLTIYLATATTGLAATLLPGANLMRTITIGVMVLMVLAIIAILEAPLRKTP